MNSIQIENCFKQLSKTPCWNVEKGIGSFLTFEFGMPQIEFTKPKIYKELKSPFNQNESRRVFIKGSEMLWIYCCDWKIYNQGTEIAHNESNDNQINLGTKLLTGQKLLQINIDIIKAETIFMFDLGGKLKTYNENYEGTDESWKLYLGNSVLAMNNLGQFNLSNGDIVVVESDFVGISEKSIEITLHNKR